MSNDEGQKYWGVHPHRVLPSPKPSSATVFMRFFLSLSYSGMPARSSGKFLTTNPPRADKFSQTNTKGKAEGQPRIEARSLPDSLVAHPRDFTFYLVDPSARLRGWH
jgi:hypothetical protein